MINNIFQDRCYVWGYMCGQTKENLLSYRLIKEDQSLHCQFNPYVVKYIQKYMIISQTYSFFCQ